MERYTVKQLAGIAGVSVRTKQDFEQLKQASGHNRNRLSSLLNEDPAGLADKQADAYAGLGDLYVSDERYTAVDGKPHPEFARFISIAVKHFGKKLKQQG